MYLMFTNRKCYVLLLSLQIKCRKCYKSKYILYDSIFWKDNVILKRTCWFKRKFKFYNKSVAGMASVPQW
jgi:hypothetical protein